MATPNICHYGALARVYVEHDEWTEDEKFSKGCFKTNKKAPYKADKDLLLALGDTHLFVLRRKQLQTRSCVCMSPQELTIDSSTQQRLASNFQCPHVTSYDDYEQWAAIEYALIVQVQLTFRTLTSESPRSNNGVAARTKDCLVVVKDGSKLWIEFEHNSGRGAFLDALMAASAPHVMLDLNYADLASPNQVELDTNQEESSHSAALKSPEAQGAGRMVFEFQRAASRLAVILALEMDADDLDIALYGETEHDAVATKGLSSVYTSSDQPQLSFEFRRATLRKAVESRILLSLQLSSELELDDPHCHFLLGTAMELSGALDEPDLHALTWLASGFINLERALMATPMTSTTLAQSQLEHAIKLARDHSLRFQLALALACCGDLNRLCTKQYATARTLLVEAARLMPAHTLDTVGKMQLHSKIHRLSLAVSPRNENATHDKNVIDLWKTLSTALSSTTTSSQYPLLRPVIKSRTDRSRFCFVEVHDATEDATTSKRPHRLRVYFTEQTTFQWLRDEIAERCNTVPMFDPSEETEHTTAQVVGFYDSISKSSSMIPWTARIAEITRLDWHVLHALVHQTVCTDVETPEDATNDSPRVAKPMAVMVRCTKCHKQLPLHEAESHPETCS